MADSDHPASTIERYGLIAIVLFLIGQTIAAVIWGAKLETRVEVMEVRGPPASDGFAQRLILMEERQRIMTEQLRQNTDKLNNLIDGLRSQIPTPQRNSRP